MFGRKYKKFTPDHKKQQFKEFKDVSVFKSSSINHIETKVAPTNQYPYTPAKVPQTGPTGSSRSEGFTTDRTSWIG